jgi:crotonobetainyl-CoA:carnitine CoA-transferase CaiB-like acyl-CoA transferase
LQSKTTDDVLSAARAWGFLAAPVASIADVARNPHFLAHGLWSEPGTDDRDVRVPLAVAHVTSEAFAAGDRPAPGVGDHNGEVYGDWLGLSKSDLDALATRGAI